MPDSEDVLDTSYFQCRYQPSFSDKHCFPNNENGDSSESGSSGCLSNDHNDGVLFDDPLSFLLRNVDVFFFNSIDV